MTRDERPPLVFALAAALAALLLCLPLVALAGRVRWGQLAADLWAPEVRDAVRLSLGCSLAATFLSVVLGVPLAWVLARSTFPGRTLVRALVALPMVLPPVVGGVVLLLAFGRNAFAGRLLEATFGVQLPFTTAGVVVAETFVAMPFLVLTAEAAFRSVESRYEDAARTLGAARWTVIRRVVVPLAAPSLGAGAALAWARALGEFGATITFAGSYPGRTQTVPTQVYLLLESGRTDTAAALSLVLVAVSLVVLVGLRRRWLPLP